MRASLRIGVVRALTALTALALVGLGACGKETTAPAPTPARSVLSGSVQRPGGAAAAGASVNATGLTSPSSPVFVTTTDASGGFSIAEVPTGSYRVSSFVPPDTGAAITVVMPSSPVTLQLSLPGYVRGNASRTGVTDQRGIFVPSTFPFSVGTTDSVGAYVVWLPPGHWQLLGFSPGYTSNIVAVDVITPGDTIQAAPLNLVPDRGP